MASTNKYATAKIYKVVDNSYTMCYYGSTTQQLSRRMAKHRLHYRLFGDGKFSRISVFDIFDAHGADNCKIELVEECPCETKEQLNRREGAYIRDNECVNKQIAGRSLTERLEDTREHRNQIARNWRAANLEHVREIRRGAWHKHKDRHLEKVTCEVCGSVGIRQHAERHKLSAKHKAAAASGFREAAESAQDG